MLYYLIAFCAIAGLGASGQFETNLYQNSQSPSCPSVRSFNVDLNRMSGKWFLQLVSSNSVDKNDDESCKQDLWDRPVGNTARVVLSAYSSYLGYYSEVVTDLSFNRNAYNMTVRVPVVEDATFQHYIIDTDYSSYVVYYVCINDGTNTYPSVWAKTRELDPSFSVQRVVQNALNRNGFPYLQLTQVDHSRC